LKLNIPIRDNLSEAVYYAPRGRMRLYSLGSDLSNRYLYPSDLLIGIIGAEGAGKSTLIKGLFPGLELTNDDEGVNIRPTPIFNYSENDFFSGHTFHLDVRYELAFHQNYEIVQAINQAIHNHRRVVVEHFDLIYKKMGYNAQILFSIGEDVRVFRPSVFGPSPIMIKKIATENVKYRFMAHSAEDIVGNLLKNKYNHIRENLHSDVRHGFVIGFNHQPDIDIQALEQEVMEIIRKDIPIRPGEDDYILLGDEQFYCTGKRIHVKSSSEIEFFRLEKDYKFDPISKQYLLIGIVGRERIKGINELPPVPEIE